MFAGSPQKRSSFSYRPTVEALEARSLLDANAFVRSLYINILQRVPADAEINGWVSSIQSGMATSAVTAAFVGSSERFGLMVSQEYSNLLGRSVDPASLNYWMQQRANGASQDQVVATILSSQEYFHLHGQQNSSFVQALYADVLGAGVASESLQQFWTAQLAGGTSREEVSISILGCHEAHAHAVDLAFQQILHRNSDGTGGGSDYWANYLDSGKTESDLVAALSNSQEYLNQYAMVA